MSDTPPQFSPGFQDQFLQLLRWRRDVRHFRPDKLPDGLLDQLIAEAALSPSVGNCQPWRFVTIAPGPRRQVIRDSFERCNAKALNAYRGDRAQAYAALKLSGLDDAPEHLAVFCNPNPAEGAGLGRATMPETVAYSVVGAIQTLWLSARLRGIGVGWVSIIEPDLVCRTLDIPRHWQFIAYLCIGYPKRETDTPELVSQGWQNRLDPARYLHRR